MNDPATPVRVRALQDSNPQRPAAKKMSPDDIIRREMGAMTPTQMNQFWTGQRTQQPQPIQQPGFDWPRAALALAVTVGGFYFAYRLFKQANVDAAGVAENVSNVMKETPVPIDGGSEYERYLAGLAELRK